MLLPAHLPKADSSRGPVSTPIHRPHGPTRGPRSPESAPRAVSVSCRRKSHPSLLQYRVIILVNSLLPLNGLILLNGHSSLVLQETHTVFQRHFHQLHEILNLLQDLRCQFVIDWYCIYILRSHKNLRISRDLTTKSLTR